jgi:hypothetical protein
MARQSVAAEPAAPADTKAADAAGKAGPGRQAEGEKAPAPARRARAGQPAATAPNARTAADDEDTRREIIAVAAYYRAERRGFADGLADDDWFEAEREVELRLNGPAPAAVA